ncbi:MAG: acetate kinase [Clostridia bacterium]|nr:acetate kinase [Clostridia bacterium]
MKILVINAGSSSLKYQLIDMDGEQVVAKGLCERVGIDGKFTHKLGDGTVVCKELEVDMPDHTTAFAQVKKALTTGEGKVINDLSEITAIGHRVVQGGSKYDRSVRIDEEVLKAVREYEVLAPLHNPACLKGIEAATETFGTEIPQVAVFDTAFHQTMPEVAYLWGLPYEYYTDYGIRRYGYHGSSHRFVSAICCELLGKPDGKGTRIITCHLGNGSSLAALKDGKVIDTTMGMTPLDGFLMGTRSGAIDPSVVTFLMEKEGLTPKQMDDVMNKKSGMLGISGVSSDDRDITAAMDEGNPRAKLAWDMRSYQILKYIGGYVAALGGLDAIVFTAGIGENQDRLRAELLEGLSYLGVKLDAEANKVRGQIQEITTPDSAVRAFVIPTNEELVIARDTKALI